MKKILIYLLGSLLLLSISLNLFQYSSTANTQKILDKLCADETARLRSELLEARNSQSNSLQTQYLISQLRPYPTPSYQVSSPYESITPTA